MLKTFQAEAKKQAELSTELDDNTEEKLAKCRTFFDKYNSKVPEQLDLLRSLNSDLRSLVLDNEEKRQRDAELNQLVRSDEYQKLANELRELSTVVTDLNFFNTTWIEGFQRATITITINDIDENDSVTSSNSSISNISSIQEKSEDSTTTNSILGDIIQKQEIYNILHFIDRHNLDKRKKKKNNENQCSCSII